MKPIRNYIKYVKKNKLFIVIIGLIILAGFIHFIQKKNHLMKMWIILKLPYILYLF